MALHWRPVGPEPARTYWERRAVVALAALLPVVLLLSLVGGDDEDRLSPQASPAASAPAPRAPTPAPTTSGTPSATPSASPGSEQCDDDVLRLDPVPAEQTYPVDAEVRLELRVTNTGPTPCSRDLGQAAVELLVVSGDDRIWSSDDCAPGGTADVVVLDPGTPEVSRVTWPGTRSLPGCGGDEARALPGTYRVAGRVGDLRAEGGSFTLE
jgi:hypothetical protein